MTDHNCYTQSIINDITKDVMESLGFVTSINTKRISEGVAKFFENRIALIWCLEDVLCQATEMKIHITDDEAREVLTRLVTQHDCEHGVTWDTIKYHILDVCPHRISVTYLLDGHESTRRTTQLEVPNGWTFMSDTEKVVYIKKAIHDWTNIHLVSYGSQEE